MKKINSYLYFKLCFKVVVVLFTISLDRMQEMLKYRVQPHICNGDFIYIAHFIKLNVLFIDKQQIKTRAEE